MAESIGDILSGGGESTPQPEKPERIADESENLIGTEQVEGQPHKDEIEQPATDGDGKAPPFGAIRQAEREKATKRYTEQVADFEKKLADQQAAFDNRFNQLVGMLQRPQQADQQQAKPDFWENPEAAVKAMLEPVIGQLTQSQMAQAELVARSAHGSDKVQEAEQAFLQAYKLGQIDPADYQRVVSSPNRWDAAVRWNLERQTRERIGTDPAAFEKKIRDEERAAVLAEIQQTGRLPEVMQPSAATPAMPSNLADVRSAGQRGASTWAGPPSMSDILSSSRSGKSIFKT